MIFPIVAYGHPVLREVAKEIKPGYPGLKELIANMYETMYHAHGVGLAAPQIGKSIRIFIVDSAPMGDGEYEDAASLKTWKKVFINPKILEEEGEPWAFEEGCLSIPDIREDVSRPKSVTIKYMDEDFQPQTETYTGLRARIIQHEHDHLQGKLFTDYLSAFRRQLLKSRLARITKGKIDPDYPMIFPKK